MLREIEEAHKQGIMMTCSAHDEGSRLIDAWPASYHMESRSLITFAACGEYGKVLRDTREVTYDYLIRGQDVTAGFIPFLKSEDTITGSSVSTALAAGLSSLILLCDRLGNPDVKYAGGSAEHSRYKLVTSQLDQMKGPYSKFLLWEKYSHIADLIKGARHIRVQNESTAQPSVFEVTKV